MSYKLLLLDKDKSFFVASGRKQEMVIRHSFSYLFYHGIKERYLAEMIELV
jgi:hypothetical protein